MKDLIYLKDVVTLRVDADKCTGCGMCLEVCPHGVLEIDEKRVRIRNRDACMECGACSRNCPVGAVSVEAGVGCAAAVINGMLNRQNSCLLLHRRSEESVRGQVQGDLLRLSGLSGTPRLFLRTLPCLEGPFCVTFSVAIQSFWAIIAVNEVCKQVGLIPKL